MALKSFVFCSFLNSAKTKQKTMCVEWYPCDNSDPEAVSGSSTKLFCVNSSIWTFFVGLLDMPKIKIVLSGTIFARN